MEGMGDEPTGTAEGAHLKRKDCDPSMNPDCFKLIESQPMVLPMSRWPDTSLVGSEIPFTRPFSTNDANVMVEELMLKTGKNSNLATKVDNSNRMERPPIRAGRWQHLYQLSGESVNGSSHGDSISKDKEPVASYGVEHKSNIFLPEFRVENPLPVPGKQSSQDHVGISEHSIKSDMNMMLSSRRTPANIPSKSGFSQFFGKNKLKERRFEQRHPKTNDGFGAGSMGQVHETRGAFNVSPNSSAKPVDQSLLSVAGTGPVLFHDGISLREWLKPGCRKVNKAESLYIFRQIVELVDLAHSRRVALQDMMPSCFKLFPSNRIRYIGSLVQKELLGNVVDQIPPSEHHLSRKMYLEQSACACGSLCPKRQKLSDDMIFVQRNPGFSANPGFKCESVNEVDSHCIGTQDSGYDTSEKHDATPEHGIRNRSGRPSVSNTARQQFLSVDPQLEKKWYTSPEEFNEWGFTFSSNIYSLGILLFELFSHFESWEVHAAAMSGLHHRILSPKFLSENPKEAGFCLWLLHPEPSSRPTTREILQSDLVCKSQELSSMDQLSLSVDEDDEAESELLLHFLVSLKEQKQKRASKLMEEIEWLKADVEEVEKRHLVKAGVILPSTHGDSNAKELGYVYNDPLSSEALLSNMNGARLTKNINQLENAYFSMRSEIQFPETNSAGHVNRDLLNNRERWSLLQNEDEELVLNHKPIDRLGAFFDGLCKYARYSKFEVLSTVRTGDLINSANVICSLSFDRDEDYFAAAGVAKKIKIFEFHALLDGSVDIHYPVIEMSSNSKFSCVCWNNYIKNYLASTDYDGLVQLWDASTGQVFSQYIEHEKRAWSVDFSQLDPTKFASGSDDCSVKLWSINEKKCIGTIRSIANVCCVQFSRSSHLMAFGSADYKTYCYDLRYTRNPWCTLAGHGKAVSYLKFLDSETLVSASTDNTLKLWDLNKTSSSGLSNGACSLTFSGHTNEKNFVGLSVSDGYIACGSETNEVYAYYRSLPMPITSHKFGSIDPISGIETENDNGLFVSSVCWREKSNMVVAANSSGSIKLLQME